MAEMTKVSLCTGLLAAILDENKELLLELQLRNALGKYEKAHPILNELKINDDLTLDAHKMPDTEGSLVATIYLIRKVQSFIEIFVGTEEADQRVSDAVSRFISDNATEIDATGLRTALPDFFGMASTEVLDDMVDTSEKEKTSDFGVPAIDALLRSGLESDATIILEGPAIVEKEILSSLFLKKGLEEGGCAVVVSTLRSPETIKKDLVSVGVDVEAADSEGRLIIVDWYTRHVRRVIGIEESGSLVSMSNDLTNLAVGIDVALKRSASFPTKRLMLDMVSPTIIVEGFDRVREFLDAVKAKLKNAKCMGLILLNPEMHPPEDVSIIEDIYDGTIQITRSVEDGEIMTELSVSSLSSGPFDSSFRLLDLDDRGLAISDTGLIFGEEDRIAFDRGDEKLSIGFPGIEAITAGGLPVGRSFLIWVSSKMTPEEILKPLLIEAVRQDHAVILALSTVATQEVNGWLGEIERSPSRLIEQGVLEIVEWQAQKDSHILGVEEQEGIIRASKDITHLGVGMDLAFRKVKEGASSLALLETLSPALQMFDIRTVYPFAQTISARLDMKGFTSFVIMDRDAHDAGVNAGMEEIFDGVLDIKDAGDHLELAVLRLRGAHFLPEYRQLSRLRSGFSVDVARRQPKVDLTEIAPDNINARFDKLNRELKEALKEKTILEQRTADLMERESELQNKHDELHQHLAALEKQMSEQQVSMEPDVTGPDATHRKELARILAVMDDMLENLPEELIERFSMSEEFKLYEKILDMYLEEEE